MGTISEALARKKEQLPQFDYMWRVDLPEIEAIGMTDPTGAALLNTAVPALNALGVSAAENSIIGGITGRINGVISNATDFVSGYAKKATEYASQSIQGIPGYASVSSLFDGGSLGGALKSQKAVESLLKSRSQGSPLSHRVFAVDLPYTAYEADKHTFGSSFFFTAANHEVGSLSAKIDEYEDGDTLRYLVAWQSLISNPDGTYNPPATYKRDIRFVRMSSSGLDLHVSIYKNCFPTEIGTSGFSYDSNGITQYNVTFVGDSIEHFFIPGNEVLAAVAQMQPSIMQGNGYGDSDFFSLSLGNVGSAALGGLVNKVLDSQTVRNLTNKVKNFFF